MLRMFKDWMKGWTKCDSIGVFAIMYNGVFYSTPIASTMYKGSRYFHTDDMHEVEERHEDWFIDSLTEDEWVKLRDGRRVEFGRRVLDSVTMDDRRIMMME